MGTYAYASQGADYRRMFEALVATLEPQSDRVRDALSAAERGDMIYLKGTAERTRQQTRALREVDAALAQIRLVGA